MRRRAEDLFFNDARTFGIWPVLFVETGFGANAGARLVHRDLLGHSERLWLRAGWGGIHRQIYEAQLDTGRLLGSNAIFDVRGGFRMTPRARFFGIGPSDEREIEIGPAESVQPPLDPYGTQGAADTRFRENEGRWGARARLRLAEHTGFELSHVWVFRRFKAARDVDPDNQITRVYDTNALVGWNTGLFDNYTEAALVYDHLRVAAPWLSAAAPSAGWRLRLFGGFAVGITDSPTRYGLTGGEVQRFIDLFEGNRVVAVRARAEWVLGQREHIPFTDYPTLGGPDYLRGYARDRFRDRLATLLSVQYRYPIYEKASGYVFVDAGRVWDSPLAIRPVVPRVGLGGGIQLHTKRAFVTRLQLSTSIDGTFFVDFRFNPGFDVHDRY